MVAIRRSFLEGQTFGRLTPLEYVGQEYYACACACGGKSRTSGHNLQKGLSRSCGCLRNELRISIHTKHGMLSAKEYGVWTGMRHRCNSKTHPSFKDYGGRGITVCERWNDFANFMADMGPRPSEKHSLDRIDNDQGYSPENCRWATASQQHRNTRANRTLTYAGVTKPLCEWAEERGIATTTLAHRLRTGWSAEAVLFRPVGRWATSP